MKLINIRPLGRFNLLEKTVNLKIGRNPQRSTEHIFYLYRGTRIFISDKEYYSLPKKQNNNDMGIIKPFKMIVGDRYNIVLPSGEKLEGIVFIGKGQYNGSKPTAYQFRYPDANHSDILSYQIGYLNQSETIITPVNNEN